MGSFAFLFLVVEGLFGGFSSRFLLPDLVEVVCVDFLSVPNVRFDDREELIVSLWAIEANNLLDVCAFAQTLGDEVSFHVFIGALYLDSFFDEPLDVVSERFTFSMDDSFKGRHRLWLGPWSCKVGGELVTEVTP